MEHTRDAPVDRRAVTSALQAVPPASTPTSRAPVSTKPAKVPMALLPPPTHATTDVGVGAAEQPRHCTRASSPTTRWNSRTIQGYGWGPTTEPMQ